MWYGHHPFFLFLIPGLIGEKIQKKSISKQRQEEKAIERAIELQNKKEKDINIGLKSLREHYAQTSKDAKPHFIRLGISTLVFFIFLFVRDVPSVFVALAFLSVVGIIVFGIISFVYYVDLENISNNICVLEEELKRRKKNRCNTG